MKTLFKNNSIGLIFTIVGQELWLLIVDSDNRQIEVKGLAFDYSNLSGNLLDVDQDYSIDLFMVYGHYVTESALPPISIGFILSQQQQKLSIVNCKVLA